MDPRRIEEIARRHGIRLLLQFGSTVTGTARADSDLDLAVLLAPGPFTFEQHAQLIADLQAVSPDRDVDVALLNRADPLFLKKIVEHCALVYGPRQAFYELKMYAFRRYQDHRRFLALERDYVAAALRHAVR